MVTRLTMLLLLTGLFSIPQPSGPGCVHDFAGIIPSNLASELEQLCSNVESETTAEMAIVTVSSLEGMTVEEYSNTLFNSWGIGQRDTNNGVLFLTAPNERRTRIEVGFGLEDLITDARAGDIVNNTILPAFRSHDMVKGIQAGSYEIASILRAEPELAHGKKSALPRFLRRKKDQAFSASLLAIGCGLGALVLAIYARRIRHYSIPLFLITLGCIIAVVGGAIFLSIGQTQLPKTLFGGVGASLIALWTNIRSFWRYRPRSCPKCSSPMLLLDEKEDDAKLSEPERIEEKINSVNYDVWVCSSCMDAEKIRRASYFSSFTMCEKCSYKTFGVTSRKTLVAATTMSTGTAQVTGQCKSCRYKKTWEEVIPKISPPSSSGSYSSGGGGGGGGGGFSGGGSSGGGASGGW